MDLLNSSEDSLILGQYAERAYLEYAVSVVKGRALPDVSDGQKPVQRRILYAMHELGLSSQAKPRKSAAVVGDVLGKFHPHGDQSVYDALVRMAQDFSLRYPLIDGQGNFGSRDGDGAAAMRYTEARLTPIAQLLLDELDEATVGFQKNYDGSYDEPILLPARLPMLLLNGASGIAVGMATEMPAHNLREIAAAAVALIKNPDLSVADLLRYCPGPDYATGAQLISPASVIEEVYTSGRGSVRLRARYHIEDRARGQWQVVFDQLPPQVSSQKILEEIEELTNPKIKAGKKSLSPEQAQLKQDVLSVLDRVRDESGKDAAVRLVFEPKSKNQNQDEFVAALLAHTSLENNCSINLVAIGIDGRPAQKNLLNLLSEWIAFRFQVVQKRTQFQLNKVQDRIHILQGRQTVFLQVERVIKVIREADDPKADLIAEFGLSEIQADDILEMRLRQLVRLEAFKIEKELNDLQDSAERLNILLGDANAMKKQIIKEIEQDAKKFGDDRRTVIEEASRAQTTKRISNDPVTVIISQKGWLRIRQGHELSADLSFKTGDALYAQFMCMSSHHLLAFGSDGRVYSVALNGLNTGRGDGIPMVSLIDLAPESHLMHFYAAPLEQELILAVSNGYGFLTQVGDMVGRMRAGKQYVTISSDETLLPPLPVSSLLASSLGAKGNATGNATTILACLTHSGFLLTFSASDLKRLVAGGKGMMLQKIQSGDYLLGIARVSDKGVVISGQDKKHKAISETLNTDALRMHFLKRGHKGLPCNKTLKKSMMYFLEITDAPL